MNMQSRVGFFIGTDALCSSAFGSGIFRGLRLELLSTSLKENARSKMPAYRAAIVCFHNKHLCQAGRQREFFRYTSISTLVLLWLK